MERTTGSRPVRKASIKETGEEISTADWARFEAAAENEPRARRLSDRDAEEEAGDRRKGDADLGPPDGQC